MAISINHFRKIQGLARTQIPENESFMKKSRQGFLYLKRHDWMVLFSYFAGLSEAVISKMYHRKQRTEIRNGYHLIAFQSKIETITIIWYILK